jgi:hypothetical protein
MSELSIVIVSYNTRNDLDACLRSLHDSPPATSHEIVVVDNASPDGSAAAVRAAWPKVQVIDAGSNVGYARANNLGIRATSSQFILLLNSDTTVPRGAIDALIDRLQSRPDVGAVGPRLVDRNGQPELSFGRMIGPFSELLQKGKRLALAGDFPVVASWIRRSLEKPTARDWVSGACLLVRRTDAERVGLLDEQFFLYLEDVDFCAALRRAGRQVWFSPDIEVVHHRGRSGATSPGATRTAYRLSQLAFYDKHRPSWAPYLRLYLRAKGELPADTSASWRP